MEFGMDFDMAPDAPMMMEAMAFDGPMMEDAAPAPMQRPDGGRGPNKDPDRGQVVNKQNGNADGAEVEEDQK